MKNKAIMMATAIGTMILITSIVSGSAGTHPPGSVESSPEVVRLQSVIDGLANRLDRMPDDKRTLSKLANKQLEKARRTGQHADLAAAELTFASLIEQVSGMANGHLGVAYSLLGQHRFREALDAARIVGQLEPAQPATWALLGDVHFAIGNDAEAESFFVRLLNEQLTLHSLSRMGMMYEHRGMFVEAEAAYCDALEAGRLLGVPDHELAWCHMILGEFHYGTGQLDRAADHFHASVSLDAFAPNAKWRLAQIDLLNNEPLRARRAIEDLVVSDPRPGFLVTMSQVCARLGDDRLANAWADRAEAIMASEIDGGEMGHARELVELWLWRGTNFVDADALAMRELESVRQDARTYESAAWSKFKLGLFIEAEQLIDISVRRSSSSSRTLWRAAAIKEACGKTRAAALLRQRAKRRNQHAEQAAALISAS